MLRTFEGHTDRVRSAAFSPDSATLATGSYDKKAILWDVQSGRQLRTLRRNWAGLEDVSFSPDGQTLALASGAAFLSRVSDDTVLATLEGPTESVRSVAFSPQGATLASGSDDRTVGLWDLER